MPTNPAVAIADPRTARLLARFLHARAGGVPAAASYLNEDESASVVIATFKESPVPGRAVFSTAGLSSVPNVLDGDDIRVELMACAAVDDEAIENVLAMCAFAVASSGWLAAPGVVFPDVVAEYVRDTTVPHLMWTEPSRWRASARQRSPTWGSSTGSRACR